MSNHLRINLLLIEKGWCGRMIDVGWRLWRLMLLSNTPIGNSAILFDFTFMSNKQ